MKIYIKYFLRRIYWENMIFKRSCVLFKTAQRIIYLFIKKKEDIKNKKRGFQIDHELNFLPILLRMKTA